jgi:hypothetical protein
MDRNDDTWARRLLQLRYMRTLSLVPTLALFVFAAGCTQETAPTQVLRHGTTTEPGAPAPGASNNGGDEHGPNIPAGPTSVPDPGTQVSADATWADGKQIAANMTIAAGTTVTIAPGAVVTFADNVALTVIGTLKVAATATKHSKFTGQTWGGIVIAPGGTLTADGLDFENAGSAIWTQAGNADATYTNGVITGQTPFKMEATSKLAVSKSTVTSTAGSAIAGTFSMSYVTYTKSGGGISINDPAAVVTITDSTLKGGSTSDSDFLVSSAAHTISLSYSTITQVHCSIHFDAVDQFTIDHSSLIASSYGAMLYGSGAGPHTITSSNVTNDSAKGLDMQGTNGPLTITKSFTANNSLATNATETNKATANVPDAQPRPATP